MNFLAEKTFKIENYLQKIPFSFRFQCDGECRSGYNT